MLVACHASQPSTTTAPREPAASCAPRTTVEANVVAAVTAMYAALATDDAAAFHAATTPSFYAFERGERFERDPLLQLIVDAHARGRRFEWNVTAPNVRFDCTLAVVSYVNVGKVGDATAMQAVEWLETATLTYESGRWLVAFLHSTPVRPAAPPATTTPPPPQ